MKNIRQLKMKPVVRGPDLTIMIGPPDKPTIMGDGNYDFICSGCPRILVKSVEQHFNRRIVTETPGGLIIECAKCGALSAFPDTGAPPMH